MSRNKIGEKLKELRKEKNLTVTEVADACGISHQAITMYETGERVPRDEVKLKLANLFETTVESIFFT